MADRLTKLETLHAALLAWIKAPSYLTWKPVAEALKELE